MNVVALKNLEAIMSVFAEANLRAMPTLFCGHMSGVNWLPDWTLDSHTPSGRFRTISGERESLYGIGDFYIDQKLLNAQLLFTRTVGSVLRGHPALHLWDLGNEFSNLREPNSPDDAATWSYVLSEMLHQTSEANVTGGIHGEDIERDRHIRPSSISAPWEIATMHGYSVYSTFSRGRLDTNVVPFLARLVQSFTSKPLLFSEFGNPTCIPGIATSFACLSEEEMYDYALAVLHRLHAQGAIGAMWWCWADYAKELSHLPPFDKAPHELTFGIIRNDGSEKPIAQALKQFASENRQVTPYPEPIVGEQEFYNQLPSSIETLYNKYCDSLST